MIRLFALVLLITFYSTIVHSQEEQSYLSIRGTVLNAKTRAAIPYASISLKDNPIGINANEEGRFELNIETLYEYDSLHISAVGFVSQDYSIASFLKANDKLVYLQDTAYLLENVFITSIPAKEIVSRAIRNIPKNYQTKPFMLKGFYRTSFRENNKYVRLLESALEVYDEGFETRNGISVEHQRMRKSYDFRKYKWRENANYLSSFIMGDFVRNPDGNIQDLFGRWNYTVKSITYLDKDEVFLVEASLPVGNSNESYFAQLYIRIKDYAILQLSYQYKWNPEYFPGVDIDSVTIKRTGVEVKTFYRQFRGKLYLSYQLREAKWNIYDKTLDGKLASIMEINDELLIHKVDPIHNKQPEEKLPEKGDIYRAVERYDKNFWKRYNKPVDTELFRAIKRDLEKEEALEKQFKAEKMDDVLN